MPAKQQFEERHAIGKPLGDLNRGCTYNRVNFFFFMINSSASAVYMVYSFTNDRYGDIQIPIAKQSAL